MSTLSTRYPSPAHTTNTTLHHRIHILTVSRKAPQLVPGGLLLFQLSRESGLIAPRIRHD